MDNNIFERPPVHFHGKGEPERLKGKPLENRSLFFCGGVPKFARLGFLACPIRSAFGGTWWSQRLGIDKRPRSTNWRTAGPGLVRVAFIFPPLGGRGSLKVKIGNYPNKECPVPCFPMAGSRPSVLIWKTALRPFRSLVLRGASSNISWFATRLSGPPYSLKPCQSSIPQSFFHLDAMRRPLTACTLSWVHFALTFCQLMGFPLNH